MLDRACWTTCLVSLAVAALIVWVMERLGQEMKGWR
jgi:hypothetical protein